MTYSYNPIDMKMNKGQSERRQYSVDQKVNFVVGFINIGMTKKAYCAKHGLNADVFGRWCKAYEDGTLVASGNKPVAKAKSLKVSNAKPKPKTKAKGKTARSVIKSSVKTKKPYSFWTRRADKKTILSLMADNERYSIQLSDRSNEVADMKKQIKDLQLQVADWKNQAERLAWNA